MLSRRILESCTARVSGPSLRIGARSTLAVATVVTTLLVVFRPAYGVNDDLALTMFASGGYTGSPSPHLVFMGALPGLLLVGLYTIAGNVPWYPLFLLVLLTLSLGVVSAVVWRNRAALGAARCGIAALAVGSALPMLVLDLTFTAVALMVGVAGVVALCAVAGASSRGRSQLVVVAVIALASASTLRWHSFVGVVAVLAPTIVVAGWRAGRRTVVAVVVATIATIGVTRLADAVVLGGERWEAYDEFNAVRGSLHGSATFDGFMANQTDPTVNERLTELDWTWVDLALFQNWFFDDPTVYSTERLTELRELVGESTTRDSISEAVKTVTEGRSRLLVVPLLGAVVSLFVLGWRGQLFVGVQLVWSAAVLVATASLQRLPDRVAVALLLGVALAVSVVPQLLGFGRHVPAAAARTDRAPFRDPGRVADLMAGALLVGLGVSNLAVSTANYSARAVSRGNDALAAQFHTQIAVLDEVDPVGRYVYAGAWINIDGSSPFDAVGPYEPHRLLGIGWPTFSPLYEARRERLGLPGDLLRAFVEQEHLYLVIGEAVVPLVKNAYERRLGLTVEFIELGRLDSGAGIYEVRVTTL